LPLRVGIPQQPYTYFVDRVGSRYIAQDRRGRTKFSNDEIGAVINECIGDIKKGGKIELGAFPLTDPAILETTIKFPESNIPIHLVGMGYDKTELHLADGKNIDMVDISPTSNCYFHEISYLTLDGNKANNTSGRGVYITDADGGSVHDFHLKHVYIHDCAEEGLYTKGLWGHRYVHSLFERCGKDGMYVVAGSSGHLAGCRFGANGNFGLQFAGRDTTILDCEFETAQKSGLYIGNVHNRVIGGFIRDNSQAGVGSYSGLWIGAAGDYTRVVGVEFDGNNREAYGVDVKAGATDCRIDECDFFDHTTGPISDAGTRTRINGLGREAAGVGGIPTAANWDIGDLVRNTDDNTLWIKCADGVMRQLA